MPEVLEAAETLTGEGMSVEVIDLRVLKEMDTETLVNSVAKTKRLLTVDQSYYTLCPGAEVIARVAENVDGRTLQARRLPRRAAAGLARDVPVDASECRPHRRSGPCPCRSVIRKSAEPYAARCDPGAGRNRPRCTACASGVLARDEVKTAFWEGEQSRRRRGHSGTRLPELRRAVLRG